MASVREQCLDNLFSALVSSLSAADRTIVRNEEEPQKILDGGYIILRDGDSGEPESVTLSPVRYAYEHVAEITVLVKERVSGTRDDQMDLILKSIDSTIIADRTLSGVCDYVESRAPDTFTERESGVLVKVAIVPVMIRFVTENPLS